VLVGGFDPEMADPRLNEELLRRVALESGGRYVPAGGAAGLPGLITTRARQAAPPEQRDVWHNGWTIGLIVCLLSAEWIVRRRVGMR
jgi:hypothetical protein